MLLNSLVLAAPARHFDRMSKWWAVALATLGLTVVITAEATPLRPISCERAGSFSSNFSGDFDVRWTKCRIKGMKHSPAVSLYGSPPYAQLSWPEWPVGSVRAAFTIYLVCAASAFALAKNLAGTAWRRYPPAGERPPNARKSPEVRKRQVIGHETSTHS